MEIVEIHVYVIGASGLELSKALKLKKRAADDGNDPCTGKFAFRC